MLHREWHGHQILILLKRECLLPSSFVDDLSVYLRMYTRLDPLRLSPLSANLSQYNEQLGLHGAHLSAPNLSRPQPGGRVHEHGFSKRSGWQLKQWLPTFLSGCGLRGMGQTSMRRKSPLTFS